jgi:16S rRNA (guanine527-N7)-methyltransferase
MRSHIGDLLIIEGKKQGISLSESEVTAFESYAAELKKWNSKVNLTSITKDSEIAIKHFIDSLNLLPFISEGNRLLDIGSGAGMPIIPLKIMRQEIPMVSIDAVAKKINFQRHVVRLLCLQNIEAVHGRVEDLDTSNGLFKIITSRAFTRLDRFVTLAAPLLEEDGVIIAMKGYQALGEITASDDLINNAGFTITAVKHYSLPMGMGERVLTFIKRSKAA